LFVSWGRLYLNPLIFEHPPPPLDFSVIDGVYIDGV
jgi:hypothetical protein